MVNEGDQDRPIIERRGVTTKATHTPRAETTEQESERTDTEDEVIEPSASGTGIEDRAEEMMEIAPLDAIVICSRTEEVAEENVVIEADGMVAVKIAMNLPRRPEAARRARPRRQRRGSPRQI